MTDAAQQAPPPGGVVLDHVAHWVPDLGAAAARLAALGFAPTPYSRQSVRPAPGAPPAPAGTANRCVMLARGYIEVLTAEGDTPNAAALRQGMARYVGLHLVAFGAAEARTTAQRLAAAGFETQPIVDLSRPIGTPEGEGLARFSVVRGKPGAMPEGRIQYCVHHTPELLWQKRWLAHRNGAVALEAVYICVAEAGEAAARYARFLGRAPGRAEKGLAEFTLERGAVVIGEQAPLARRLPGLAPPSLPFIAGYALKVRDLGATRAALDQGAVAHDGARPGMLAVAGGPDLGGAILFRAGD